MIKYSQIFKEDIRMEDKLNNTPEDMEQTEEKPVYTDPNADVTIEDAAQSGSAYQYTQSEPSASYAGYQQNNPSQSGQSSYQYQDGQNNNYQYQDNLNYNIGNNMGYNQNHYQDMDTSPMSMGDWLLTILAAMIPCAGLVLYIVWAFGSTGNVNRRNFCRAQLIIMAVVFVLYMIIAVVFGMTYLSRMY